MAITGQITNVGDHIDVSYSGGVQQYEIPINGLYQLEVGGGRGGLSNNSGYSKGYKLFKKGTILYICIGGNGGYVRGSRTSIGGGYNGGGSGHCYGDEEDGGGGGGGATHIALVDGTLASIGYQQFVTNGKGLIVAGGSGGGETNRYGGAGGGLNGQKGEGNAYPTPSQTQGASFGAGSNGEQTYSTGGGGGGLYGGYGGYSNSRSGDGGSGYIGGVPSLVFKGTTYSPTTTLGGSSSSYAKITFIAKSFPTIYLGETQIDGAHLGGLDLDTIYLGENELA